MTRQISIPTELWVFPRSAPSDSNLPWKAHSLEAYRTKQAAMDSQNHSWVEATWRDGVAPPVRFTVRSSGGIVSMYAPKDSWFVMDYDNGNPEKPDGRIWVFSFKSRKEGRDYRKYLDELRKDLTSTIISVSAPFKLFQ